MAPVTLQCRPTSTTASGVEHLIVILSENHSFDSYFGKYCTATAGSSPTCGYGPQCCEAAPVYLTGSNGIVFPVTLTDATNLAYDPSHSKSSELCEQNGGKLDKYISGGGCPWSSDSNFAVATSSSLSTYYSYAQKYALADRLVVKH